MAKHFGNYTCQYCHSPFLTETARDQHEENCSENPANAENED